jgi:hypothetical protein
MSIAEARSARRDAMSPLVLASEQLEGLAGLVAIDGDAGGGMAFVERQTG